MPQKAAHASRHRGGRRERESPLAAAAEAAEASTQSDFETKKDSLPPGITSSTRGGELVGGLSALLELSSSSLLMYSSVVLASRPVRRRRRVEWEPPPPSHPPPPVVDRSAGAPLSRRHKTDLRTKAVPLFPPPSLCMHVANCNLVSSLRGRRSSSVVFGVYGAQRVTLANPLTPLLLF